MWYSKGVWRTDRPCGPGIQSEPFIVSTGWEIDPLPAKWEAGFGVGARGQKVFYEMDSSREVDLLRGSDAFSPPTWLRVDLFRERGASQHGELGNRRRGVQGEVEFIIPVGGRDLQGQGNAESMRQLEHRAESDLGQFKMMDVGLVDFPDAANATPGEIGHGGVGGTSCAADLAGRRRIHAGGVLVTRCRTTSQSSSLGQPVNSASFHVSSPTGKVSPTRRAG